MTKKQVMKRINKLYEEHMKELGLQINEVLISADMWYGKLDAHCPIRVDALHDQDRNGGDFFEEGLFDFKQDDVNDWLHTRAELKKLGVDLSDCE